jgi:hypothetical protein
MLQNIFAPAVARLRQELTDLETQAAEVRSLIAGLLARAEVADSPPAKIAPAKARPRGRRRSSRATSDAQNGAPAPAAGSDSAKELAEIVAAVACSQRDAGAAIGNKDAARLKAAMTAIAHAERRGGQKARWKLEAAASEPGGPQAMAPGGGALAEGVRGEVAARHRQGPWRRSAAT